MNGWRERLKAASEKGGVPAALGIYLAAGWVALQILDLLAGVLLLPDWFPALGVGILILGLPIVLATAWVQGKTGPSPGDAAGELPPAAPPPPSSPTWRSLRGRLTWRNAMTAGVVAFAAWGVFAAGWVLFGDNADTVASSGAGNPDRADGRRVAILPFEVRGPAQYAYLGEAMVTLIGAKLDGAGDLRSVDSRSVLGFLDGRPGAGSNPGRSVVDRFRADLWLTGDIVTAGTTLRISAAAYDAARPDGAEPVARGDAEGAAADLMEIVDRLAGHLLAELGGSPSARVQRIAAITTDSLEALRRFLDGERLYREGRFDESSDAFRAAVDIDSTFALAYYRLSLLAEWNLRGELADWAAARAVTHGERLPQREQQLLEALQIRRTGDNARAEQMYRSILSLYPEEREALIDLAEILIHAAPLRAGSFADSREVFEQVLELDPEHSTSLLHLARVAAAEGELAELDTLTARFLEINPTGDRGLEVLALRAFAGSDDALRRTTLERLARPGTSELSVALASWDVATYARDLDGAERITALLAEPGRSLEAHTLSHSWLAQIFAARGRFQDARAELQRLAEENSAVAAEFQALLALTPYAVADPAQLRDLRRRVRAIDPGRVPESANPSVVFTALDGLHAVIGAYLDGLLSAHLGDDAAVVEAAERLRGLSVPAGAGSLNLDLALAVEAERDRLAGDPAAAFEKLDGARREVWYGQTMASPYFAQARERFLQGELLIELGRDAEALPWFRHLVELGPFELAYYPVAELRQAQILERLGDAAASRRHYARFVELWADSDGVFAPQVAEARQALARLQAR